MTFIYSVSYILCVYVYMVYNMYIDMYFVNSIRVVSVYYLYISF